MILYRPMEGLSERPSNSDQLCTARLSLSPRDASSRKKLWQTQVNFGQRKLDVGQRGRRG